RARGDAPPRRPYDARAHAGRDDSRASSRTRRAAAVGRPRARELGPRPNRRLVRQIVQLCEQQPRPEALEDRPRFAELGPSLVVTSEREQAAPRTEQRLSAPEAEPELLP